MTHLVSRAYGMRAVALRFFNTYGPYQALSNPYTGVLSNFAARVLNGKAPLIYEDGLQKWDFISVYDVADACRLALENEKASGKSFNISSGEAATVKEIAERTIDAIGHRIWRLKLPVDTARRDIRHCFADISSAKRCVGLENEKSQCRRACWIWPRGWMARRPRTG